MNSKRPDLAELSAFAAVASHKSFRKAAEELRVSPSTLSHTVRALEQRVGVRLLNRTTRSVATTHAGETLLARLRPLLHELDAALADMDALRGAASGTVRINTSFTGARILLAEVVPAFRTRWPQIHLDLVTEGRLVDIVAQGFDAGVRLREAVPRDMTAVAFGGDARFVAVASPSYLAGHPAPKTPGELRAHACIRYRMQSGKIYRWELERRGQSVNVDVAGPLTLDDEQLMVQAASAGHGIAFVAEQVAREALDAGLLTRVLEPWCPRVPGLCLYYPSHRGASPALRAFVAVLKEHARTK